MSTDGALNLAWTVPLTIEAEQGDWVLILQNLCVALAHPLNRAGSRRVVAGFVRQLGLTLVQAGLLEQREVEALWEKAGITATDHVDRVGAISRCPTCYQPLLRPVGH